MLKNIKYINGDMKNGIDYDWNLIRKEYNKLKCPKDVYDPTKLPLSKAAYDAILSERSTGKTTNILLFGMCMNKLYGTVIQYIRTTEAMIMNKTINQLFKTIREYKYVSKITEGRWNDVFYHARKWCYCNIDDDGNIVEKCPDHFMYCLSIDKNDNYKSSYNAPLGDWIILDEFIGQYYRMNEFVYFMDLVKTIQRDRLSVRVILLANTIDKESEYFHEFEIYDQVQLIEPGQSDIIVTEMGTKIYLELISDKKQPKAKAIINQMYYGFKNPKLNSIRGGDWAVNDYPHFEEGYKVLQRGIYIDFHDKLLGLDIVEYPNAGIYLHVRRATQIYDDSIVYSLKNIIDSRYRYYQGRGDALDKFIAKMVFMHRIRFQNNACGTIFVNHWNKKDAKRAIR